ncbi:MAG: uroporphyrinogen-III C-methyltransferase [Gammaproteobacteria bacterium]|nr:uroporphyrinogen-III C-methyltransferase [Gammaproteobacteria bacterium]
MQFLPVFLDLRGRSVLLVGGGVVADRKLALLLRAGARVRLVAPAIDAAVAERARRGGAQLQQRGFEPADLADAWLAIAATDDAAVNAAVAAAAGERGVYVNVVDDAAASSALMPAIIDRSPVLVAIGTAGTSPTLARRVRALVEAALPEHLGALAALAARWRSRVRAALPQLDARRHFWEAVLEGAAARAVARGGSGEPEMAAALAEAAFGAVAGDAGEVWLIGAGPGDPDLLTLRALQLLQRADVVLYDRLVGAAVLERARRDAERIYVGKESGQHRTTQEHINALLLEHARRGRKVARLKGGDPFIFGRGGEEIEVLAGAGIPVTVVPGITAALGAAASIGVSLTQRQVAQSVCLVTVMGAAAEALDWRALTTPLQTVVFYMAVAEVERICARLVAHGAPPTRPALLVERATCPGQRIICGNLSDIAARAVAARAAAPALLVVGAAAQPRLRREIFAAVGVKDIIG